MIENKPLDMALDGGVILLSMVANADDSTLCMIRSERELGQSLQYWEKCFTLSNEVVPSCLQPIADKVSSVCVCVCMHTCMHLFE